MLIQGQPPQVSSLVDNVRAPLNSLWHEIDCLESRTAISPDNIQVTPNTELTSDIQTVHSVLQEMNSIPEANEDVGMNESTLPSAFFSVKDNEITHISENMTFL